MTFFSVERAKLNLIITLLQVSRNTLTDNEIDTLYYLMKDKDIQEILEKAKARREQ